MKINQLKAGVILSYISEAIAVLSGLIYTPVMLRILGQSEYGLYQLSSSTISYLSLLSLGFGGSYVRYYSRCKANKDTRQLANLNGMYMTVFIVIGLICAAAGAVLVLNVDKIFKDSLSAYELDTAKILMALMIFNMAISFPGSVFSSYITANEQYVFLFFIAILRNILNPFLTIPLLLLGYKSIAVVGIQTVLSITSLLANVVFCNKRLGITFDFKNFEIGFLKELFTFSFWIFLNQIIDQINWSVDKFILGVFSGTVEVAVYGVSATINALYKSFSTSISGVFAPRVNKLVAEQDDNNVLTELFIRVGRIQFIVMMLILSGLIVFGKYFISVWAGPGYEESYQILLILVIPVTIPLIQNLGIEIQQAKNMHQFRSIIYFVMSIANVLISIPLAKQFGGTGAAIGTCLSLLIGNGLIMNIYYHKKIGLNIIKFWKEIISFLPALLQPFVFGIIIVKFVAFKGIIGFLILIVLYTMIYGESMWLLGLNAYEKNLIVQPVKKILSEVRK